jgi:hypothetical protein
MHDPHEIRRIAAQEYRKLAADVAKESQKRK